MKMRFKSSLAEGERVNHDGFEGKRVPEPQCGIAFGYLKQQAVSGGLLGRKKTLFL